MLCKHALINQKLVISALLIYQPHFKAIERPACQDHTHRHRHAQPVTVNAEFRKVLRRERHLSSQS